MEIIDFFLSTFSFSFHPAAAVPMDLNMGVESDNEALSLVHIHASEIFPMRSLHLDDAESSLTVPPFATLCGESVMHLGSTADGGIIALSNYRLFIHCRDIGIFNVPLIMIDVIECRDIFYLHISCKDARYFRCTFKTNEQCLEWYKRLVTATYTPKKLEDLFAFAYYAWCFEERKEDLYESLHHGSSVLNVSSEVGRLCLDKESSNGLWRVSTVNSDYRLSSTYPTHIVVPEQITDAHIESAAKFRSLKRFPAVVWRHRKNGCVLARCSQPEVGLLGWRSESDEELVKAITLACTSRDNVHQERQNEHFDAVPNGHIPNGRAVHDKSLEEPKKLLIIDARSYSAAFANRAKGGGCECPEYYPHCEIQFMGLANIHSIRKSFQSLRSLCTNPPDSTSWYSAMENTRWLHNISALLKSALCVVNAIDQDDRPVLVHCSDGWDRTPQITALAELLLDPYYRTMEGFQVLVEREWLEFGHKFGDRCGSGINSDDMNERCPVFLQWVDCVYQLSNRYPCSFEFNHAYLIKLVHHVYSCLFGSFLCNSSFERHGNKVKERTFSIWSFFKSFHQRFRNYLYIYKEKVLRPSCQLRDMSFWSALYLPTSSNGCASSCYDEFDGCLNQESISSDTVNATSNLTKTRSCEDLLSNQEIGSDKQRRLSDPNLVETLKKSYRVAVNNNDGNHTPVKIGVNETRFCSDCDVTSNMAEISLDSCEETDGLDAGVGFANGNAIASRENENGLSLCVIRSSGANNTGLSTPDAESGPSSECSSGIGENKSLKHRLISGIDGSTDTLVAEGGAISNANRSECDNSYELDRNDDERTKTSHYVNDHPIGKCMSTSTTEISDSSVCNGFVARSATAVSLKQAMMMLACNQEYCVSCSASKMAKKSRPFNRQHSNSSAISSIYSTPIHSRTPSSGFPATPNEDRLLSEGHPGFQSRIGINRQLDIDGLMLVNNDVQNRLQQLFAAHKAEVETLKRDLYVTRLALCQQVCNRCNFNNSANANCHDCNDEVVSLPDSTCSGEHQSVGHDSNDGMASDVSWEHVDEGDTNPTLWVPDHAATKCSGCETEFWLGRRKHHCRNCGKIFCGHCSDHLATIPNEQLYHPVRVCKSCFDILHVTKYRNNSGLMACGNGYRSKIANSKSHVAYAAATTALN